MDGDVMALTENKETEEFSPDFHGKLLGIDVTEALERINCNQRLFRSMLFEFYDDYATAAHTIRIALARNREDDVVSAGHLAHTVKGIAGTISAKRLFDAALAMEKVLNQPSEVRLIMLDEFESALDQVIKSIGTMKQQDEEAVASVKKSDNHVVETPLDLEKIYPLMEELAQRIKGKEFETLETFIKLKPFISGASGEVGKELKYLEEQINNIDFEGAERSLMIIAKSLGDYMKESPT
ncbi:MAG: Hpt domain-containing protein [Magnetococcales bacterium]|nr:Hpt domain-containing protein [Magnetococcales bacterium]